MFINTIINAEHRKYFITKPVEISQNYFVTERRCPKCRTRMNRHKWSGIFVCLACREKRND